MTTQYHTITIEVFKNKTKANITWTPKYNIAEDKTSGVKAANITGTCVDVAGLIASTGEDLSASVKGRRTTLAFTPKMAKEVLLATQDIFKQRASLGNKKPLVHIKVKALRVSPLPNTFYVSNIVSFEVIADAEQSLDADVFKAIAGVNQALEQDNPRKASFISNLVTALTTEISFGKKVAK